MKSSDSSRNFRGISIHRADCSNIESMKNDKTHRIVDVSWEKESQELYSARVQIHAMDRPNLVSDIISLVNELKIPLNAMNVETRKDKSAVIHLSLLIKDVNLLEECLKRLRKLSSVNGCIPNGQCVGDSMRAVVQRVLSSEVIVNGETVGRIGKGV